MRKSAIIAAAVAALIAVGGASAYVLAKTVTLAPGHCKKIHGTKVCARKVKAKTVTVTVSPSPIGKTASGSGNETLAPFTIPANGDTVHWTSQPYNDGVGDIYNVFSASCSTPGDTGDQSFDNGGSTDGATSGSSFLPAGTYTCAVLADDGGWTITF
jgi:hypothetical protein